MSQNSSKISDMAATSSFFRIFSFFVSFCSVLSSNIQLLKCPPPDYPMFGGYGPKEEFYNPGDMIHYYCDVDTYIGGNVFRVCLDSGDWAGDAPVCDRSVNFSSVEQSSTAKPDDQNAAEKAKDGNRETCSSTADEQGATWTARFPQASHVLRVMLFLPRGHASYEVLSIKEDGSEYSCGSGNRRIERYEWTFHNCLEPNNTNIVAIKIRSTSSGPLQLCEVVSHVLTDPTCVDPHIFVESGSLILTRKSAHLVCHGGYKKSRDKKLECIRTGVWNRKNLYCIDTEKEVEDIPPKNKQRDFERVQE